MQENQQSKEYKTPTFQFVRRDEQNKAFFTASGTTTEQGAKSAGATLSSIQSW